ncbi:MAG: ferredoxin reductase family protein [Frankia sp.]
MATVVAGSVGSGPTGRSLPRRSAAHWGVRAVLAAGAVAVVGLWWQDTNSASISTFGAGITAAGRVAGLVAAYLVLVQLLLMARLPWFERSVGLDRLAAWHRGLGTNVVLLIAVHVLLIVFGYSLTVHRQPIAEFWTVFTTYPDMWKATIGVILFFAVGISSARGLRARLSYEAWYWLHVTAYLAVALAFFHQTSNGADFIGHPLNKALWTLFYLAVALGILVFRVAVPVAVAFVHRMVVDRVVPEAPGVVSVWIAGRNLDRLAAAPGQFLLWRFLAPGHLLTAHPYSLSAPVMPGLLRITVKEAGDHSRTIADLKPGTRVLAEGPFGHFTAAVAARRKVLLVGGGSGIAPVRALTEELSDAGRNVTVVYRASRSADLALGGELAALAEAGRITVHWVVGTRRELGHDPLSADQLSAAVPDLTQRDIFICGPSGMTLAVLDALRRLGVRRDQIHTEDFTLR